MMNWANVFVSVAEKIFVDHLTLNWGKVLEPELDIYLFVESGFCQQYIAEEVKSCF